MYGTINNHKDCQTTTNWPRGSEYKSTSRVGLQHKQEKATKMGITQMKKDYKSLDRLSLKATTSSIEGKTIGVPVIILVLVALVIIFTKSVQHKYISH